MTTVELFTTESCGRCPTVRERLAELEPDHDFDLEVVDAEADRGRALQYGVFSVPTVVVGGEETLTGVPSKAELLASIEDADSDAS